MFRTTKYFPRSQKCIRERDLASLDVFIEDTLKKSLKSLEKLPIKHISYNIIKCKTVSGLAGSLYLAEKAKEVLFLLKVKKAISKEDWIEIEKLFALYLNSNRIKVI